MCFNNMAVSRWSQFLIFAWIRTFDECGHMQQAKKPNINKELNAAKNGAGKLQGNTSQVPVMSNLTPVELRLLRP